MVEVCVSEWDELTFRRLIRKHELLINYLKLPPFAFECL